MAGLVPPGKSGAHGLVAFDQLRAGRQRGPDKRLQFAEHVLCFRARRPLLCGVEFRFGRGQARARILQALVEAFGRRRAADWSAANCARRMADSAAWALALLDVLMTTHLRNSAID
jgi:hypothetical protein